MPLAPRKRAEAAIEATFPIGKSDSAFCNSATAEAIVIDILVPVSPSGTGKILSLSTRSLFLAILFEPEIIAFKRQFPLIKTNSPLCMST